MRSQLLCLLAASTLLGACSSTSGPDPEQQLKLHREFAQTYYEAGQYEQAAQQIELGLEIEPGDDGLLLMMAWIHIKRGTPDDIGAAEKLFRDLARGGDFRATLGLGEALERKGVAYWESAAAVESGQRTTTAADPTKRAVEMRKQAEKDWVESVKWYERTLELKAGSIQAINGLQRVWALRGDLQQSLKWSETLLAQSEKEVGFWRTELERPDLSAKEEAEYRRLLRGSAALLAETHLQASTSLVQLGRKADAIPHLDAALELVPEQADIYSRRAQLNHELGRMREARDDVQQFIRRSALPVEHPDMQRALDLLAECEQALRAPSAAVR